MRNISTKLLLLLLLLLSLVITLLLSLLLLLLFLLFFPFTNKYFFHNFTSSIYRKLAFTLQLIV